MSERYAVCCLLLLLCCRCWWPRGPAAAAAAAAAAGAYTSSRSLATMSWRIATAIVTSSSLDLYELVQYTQSPERQGQQITMRPMRGTTALLMLLAPLRGGSAFVVPQHTQAATRQRPTQRTIRSNCRQRQLVQLSAITSTDEDCGCGGAIVSGAPSEAARALDPRVAIGQSTLFSLNGVETNMDSLLGETGTSLVVFLRSLG